MSHSCNVSYHTHCSSARISNCLPSANLTRLECLCRSELVSPNSGCDGKNVCETVRERERERTDAGLGTSWAKYFHQ